MPPVNKSSQPTFVVVSQQAAKQTPYPYVHVNDDGTVRELHPAERNLLETPFLPGDGGRPAVKTSFTSRNGWGSLRGFCRRMDLPSGIEVLAASAIQPQKSIQESLEELLYQARTLGFQVVENPDGSITISRIN
jgi:hypothetical protein